MVDFHTPFSGFSVVDTAEAKAFYADTVGLEVEELPGGMLHLVLDDVTSAVRELAARGVAFERYEGMPQDEDGVMKGNGPDIAWFTDPSGNVLSIIAA